jgi:pyruvate formate lyase activating enzyme
MVEKLKEAMNYKSLPRREVECFLCSHRCRIKEGKRGFCMVRENQKGKLYSLVYGKAVAHHIDPIEKKPLFHFLPGSSSYSIATVGCNFRCSFCQNWDISQRARHGRIEGIGLSAEKIVREAMANRCQSISYTYTEPIIFFEYAYDTAVLAKKEGLYNNFVTNAFVTPETIDLMAGVIDAANVDLKSFSEDFYKKLCRAHLQPVLDAIKYMHEKGIWVEVTTLVVPGQNDSEEELSRIAGFIASVSKDIPWHVSRFYPHYEMNSLPPTPMEKIEMAIAKGKEAGLHYVYGGNVPSGDYETTYCPFCKKAVIRRFGYSIGKMNLKKGPANEALCGACGKKLAIKI